MPSPHSLPPLSYLRAHNARTQRFLVERGLCKPPAPKGDLPDSIHQFLKELL